MEKDAIVRRTAGFQSVVQERNALFKKNQACAFFRIMSNITRILYLIIATLYRYANSRYSIKRNSLKAVENNLLVLLFFKK